MTRWEYWTYCPSNSWDKGKVAEDLDALGLLGWEMVTAISIHPQQHMPVFFFKRPIG